MGKEQDLLEAGRTGSVTVIEKILNLKHKKTGPLGFKQLQGAFDSLRRPTNPNCQDANGDTPLHLAALNGHREAVTSLLHFEASANIIDNKGCQPLHLAAWNGHSDICRDLLSHGPSFANVNEQNHEGETALLCAAHFGHTEVIDILLEHSADCTIRTHKGESPLDLACQYGRLETVKLLLDKRPPLVNEISENISALHLASRNGHKAIVQLLIERGFDINTKAETGSALHEAALFGKEDVVQYLLEQGIDVYLRDSTDRSALEVLSDHKSHKSLQIGKFILEHLERLGLSPTKPRPASSLNYIHEESSRPVSVSDIYSTPVKVRKDKEQNRDRLESESSTTSSLLECTQVSERASRPFSDPIYDYPQPTNIPKGKSPALSEGSLHSPHGSPSSLASSPGRSPKSRHEIPKKPPRKKKPQGSSSGKSPGEPLFLDTKISIETASTLAPKVIHANVPNGGTKPDNDERCDFNQLKPQVKHVLSIDGGDYVSLASVKELSQNTTVPPGGKVEMESQDSGSFQSSIDIDEKHPVFTRSTSQDSSTDIAKNVESKNDVFTDANENKEEIKAIDSDVNNKEDNKPVKHDTEDNMVVSSSAENNNNLPSSGKTHVNMRQGSSSSTVGKRVVDI